jgi:hypothetical protein
MKNRLNTWIALGVFVALSVAVVKCAGAEVTPTPPPAAITIEDRALVFRDFATIDFSGQAPEDFVPDLRVRYVLVYVNGELHMLPVYKAMRVWKPLQPSAPTPPRAPRAPRGPRPVVTQ